MGLCACEKEKKKPIQTQEKPTVNTQSFVATPVQNSNQGVKPTTLAFQPSNLQPVSIKYPQPFDLQDNPQNQFFKTSRNFKLIKVERISPQDNDGNMYTFFKNGAIPGGEIIQFNLRQRTKENVFNIGIGTKATFGNIAPADCVKYQSRQLFIDNKKCFIDNQMFNIPQLQQASCFKMLINTREWTIGWFIQGMHVVTKQIPVRMRSKSFYLTVGLYSNQDELQFLQE